MTHSVADIRAHGPENIDHACEVIGKSKDRLKVFEAIYRDQMKVKSVLEISRRTGLNNIRVLQEAQKLYVNEIIRKVKGGYEKIPFYAGQKKKIAALVRRPAKRLALPTMRRPVGSAKAVIKIFEKQYRPDTKLLTIDDIDSFSKAHKLRLGAPDKGLLSLPEESIKRAILRIVKDPRVEKDWGGEKSDIYTTHLKITGRRVAAAFALKGRGTRGVLTPKGMGKNGDQVGRLFSNAAQVFLVVYPGSIQESILTQMQAFAIGRAMAGQRIYYGVIGGPDFQRLYKGYREKFH